MAKMKSILQKQINEERRIMPEIEPEQLEGKVVQLVRTRPVELAVKYVGKALRFMFTLGAFFLASVGLFALIFPTVREPLQDEIGKALSQILSFFS